MSDAKPKTPAQLRRKVEMLEAQVAELRAQLTRATGGWAEICMAKIIAEQRCQQAMRVLRGDDE